MPFLLLLKALPPLSGLPCSGQLQKLLQMISPNADSIAEGEKEADRQVQEFNNEEVKAEVTEDIK